MNYGPFLSLSMITDVAKALGVRVIVFEDNEKFIVAIDIIGKRKNRKQMVGFLNEWRPVGTPFIYNEYRFGFMRGLRK